MRYADAAAFDATFERNATPLPTRLPAPPASWRAGHADAAALLDPILGGQVASATWSPDGRRWIAHRTTAAPRP